MRPADTWKDYELLDATDGNRLERWGETILIRPDPAGGVENAQAEPAVGKGRCCLSPLQSGRRRVGVQAPSARKSGRSAAARARISSPSSSAPPASSTPACCPEQAVNWAWYAKKIRAAGRPVKVLNLFGYTGGATLACAAAGATVCHVDASKGIVAWGKDNAAASGLADRPIRWLVDDCAKFVAREKRRGNTYDGIIMDPPSYGRGPGGEIWKLEDCIYDLISQCEEVLSDTPLFFCGEQLHHRPVPGGHGIYAQDHAGAPLWRRDLLR